MPLRRTDKRTKFQKQEKRLAKEYGGRCQPASGAIPLFKGDVRTPYFLIEAKRTDKKQITIKQDWLDKIRREASIHGKIPLLALEIGDRRYVVIEDADFQSLRGE